MMLRYSMGPTDFRLKGILALLLVAACANDDEDAADSDDGAGSTSEPTSTTDDPSSAEADEDSGPEPIPPGSNGDPCATGAECMSGFCYDTGAFGAYCGECENDADCRMWGCTPPAPSGGAITPAVCSDGAAGSGCESDAACATGLVCAVTGLGFGGGTCGDCKTDADCSEGMVCSPFLDFASFISGTSCVAPASLPDGSICDYAGTGDDACENFCVESMFATVSVGVCSACETDADCTDGLVCGSPVVSMTGAMGGACA